MGTNGADKALGLECGIFKAVTPIGEESISFLDAWLFIDLGKLVLPPPQLVVWCVL